MRVLVVDDDRVSLTIVRRAMEAESIEVLIAKDGLEAWNLVQGLATMPELAILDCEMPRMDGLTLCRRIKSWDRSASIYTVMLTSRNTTSDLALGLDAGADDYIKKPFDLDELRARIRAARRIVQLQLALRHQVRGLSAAVTRTLDASPMVSMCGSCRQVKSVRSGWQHLDSFLAERVGVQVTHLYCPSCSEQVLLETLPDGAATAPK